MDVQSYLNQLSTGISQLYNVNANIFFNLELANGNKLIDGLDLDTVYQYFGLLETLPVDILYQDTINKINKYNTLKELYNNLSVFDIPRKRILTDIDNIRDVQEVYDSAYICSNCGNKKIHTAQKQMHAGDESGTVFFICAACGNRWRRRE